MNRRIALRRLGTGMAGLAAIRVPANAADTIAPRLLNDDLPIRLRSNENPYGPSPMAIAAMTASIRDSNRYHWDSAEKLISAIARKNNVEDKNILMAAGSTEILNLIGRLSCPMTGSFVVAQPSYTDWTEIAENAGLVKISIPLTGNKQIDLPALQKAIRPDTRFVYL
ncbi:MAG: aminotransferase class I/II-fold pyridoxal phosphate-dependent enzyme, partial [Bacteroidetes bacterium]|nr:aminotransferase class I/II-fold pyridoxal phosphate-dependent enzyme [Bacteroidota bacterium]